MSIPDWMLAILLTLLAVALILLIVWLIKKLIQAWKCGKWPFSTYQYSYSVVQKPRIVRHKTAIQRRRAERFVIVEEPVCAASVAAPVVEEFVAAEAVIPTHAPVVRQVKTQVLEAAANCNNCLTKTCD
ncbi:hypothetical protein AGMMS49992_06250 [Clostridia bacterium]|nr:hypothetical protein AGMMS49992_06250 [Clostridia bacterium]